MRGSARSLRCWSAAVQRQYDAWVRNKAFRDILWTSFYATMDAFRFPLQPPAEALSGRLLADVLGEVLELADAQDKLCKSGRMRLSHELP